VGARIKSTLGEGNFNCVCRKNKREEGIGSVGPGGDLEKERIAVRGKGEARRRTFAHTPYLAGISQKVYGSGNLRQSEKKGGSGLEGGSQKKIGVLNIWDSWVGDGKYSVSVSRVEGRGGGGKREGQLRKKNPRTCRASGKTGGLKGSLLRYLLCQWLLRVPH